MPHPLSKIDLSPLANRDMKVALVEHPAVFPHPEIQEGGCFGRPSEKRPPMPDFFSHEINESFSYHDMSFDVGVQPFEGHNEPGKNGGSDSSPLRNVYLTEIGSLFQSRPNDNSLLAESLIKANESENSRFNSHQQSFGKWRPYFLKATSGRRSPGHIFLDDLDGSGHPPAEVADKNSANHFRLKQSDFLLKTLLANSDCQLEKLRVSDSRLAEDAPSTRSSRVEERKGTVPEEK